MSTINYLYPVAGAAPSSKAVSTCSYVTAQVVYADGDTTAVISTNFNSALVSPNDGLSDLAAGFPVTTIEYTTAPTTTLPNQITTVPGTNQVTLTKIAQTGSACTLVVKIARPFTGVR
jgi:hypothetical protein